MDPRLPLAAAGLAWGLLADRIGARWPAHDDGSTRSVDWRSALTGLVGAVVGVALGGRTGDPLEIAFLGLYAAALVLLLATDLDQRLLPDVVTLPLIGYAVVGLATGSGPYVGLDDGLAPAIAAAVGLPLGLWLLAIPFGRGAIGLGDLKLLVSVALVGGAARAVAGLATGAILAGIVIAALLVARRLTLKSFVPYGPFLIVGALWAILGQVGVG